MYMFLLKVEKRKKRVWFVLLLGILEVLNTSVLTIGYFDFLSVAKSHSCAFKTSLTLFLQQ